MAIKRVWHGYTTPENAGVYQQLLLTEVIPEIRAKNIPGLQNIAVMKYSHSLADTNSSDFTTEIPKTDGEMRTASEVEYVVTITFESIAHVVAFAGEDYERAYIPDKARAVLSRFDDRCVHYEVVGV